MITEHMGQNWVYLRLLLDLLTLHINYNFRFQEILLDLFTFGRPSLR